MKIKVYGKSHMEGQSKRTGRPYNLNQVHYLGKNQFVEGQSAETLFLSAPEYPYDTIVVGKEYYVEFDNRGSVVEFRPA